MSWRDWFRRKERASAPALDIVPRSAINFGAGLFSTQPQASVLLAESLGIPDTAARAIANRVGSLNPQVVKVSKDRTGTEQEEVLDDHPLKQLLDRPHPDFTRSMMLRLTAQYIITVGEAYWLKVGSGFGVPVELHVFPPSRIQPLIEDNRVVAYTITEGNGAQVQRPADTVIRMYFPDPENLWQAEGYLGPSGITADALKFAGQHLRAHYQSDATPKTVLKAGPASTPFSKETLDRLHAVWREQNDARNGTRRGLPVALPTDYDLIQLALMSGADVTPLLEYWRDELLMAYAVPRSVLGQVVSGDRSSAETNQWVFDRYAVLPITTLIQESLTRQLAPDFGDSIEVQFEDFCSQDKDYELKREAQDLDKGVRSVNKVLTDRGDDEVEWGDAPMVDKGKVPYDPEAAAARADAPPAPLGGPGAPNGELPNEQAIKMASIEELKRMEQRLHGEIRNRFREVIRAKGREAA